MLYLRALMVTGLLAAVPATAVAGQVCYHSAYSSELSELIDKAEAQYPKWEAGQFLDLSKEIADSIPCLEDKVRTDLAARIHRIMGLRARVIDGDSNRARMAFAAARALQPKYVFPESMVGPTDPERADYVAIPISLELTDAVPRPSEGTIRFDGRQTLERPLTFATVFQHIDDSGEIIETAYLWPGDPTPSYFTPDVDEVVAVADSNRVVKYLLGGISAGAAGAGIALLANGAWDGEHTCTGEGEDSACVLQARDRVVGGAVLTGLGLAGFIGTGITVSDQGAGLFFSGRW